MKLAVPPLTKSIKALAGNENGMSNGMKRVRERAAGARARG